MATTVILNDMAAGTVGDIGGATGSITAPGVNGTVAQAVQGILNGVPMLVTPSAQGSGTREHNAAGITRQAVGSASVRVALPALGASREIYVMATTRCFFRTGDNTVVAAAGTSHPLAVDERFYLRVPAEHTHIAYVRDTADGNITVCAVV